jgi:hypothetical protein
MHEFSFSDLVFAVVLSTFRATDKSAMNQPLDYMQDLERPSRGVDSSSCSSLVPNRFAPCEASRMIHDFPEWVQTPESGVPGSFLIGLQEITNDWRRLI